MARVCTFGGTGATGVPANGAATRVMREPVEASSRKAVPMRSCSPERLIGSAVTKERDGAGGRRQPDPVVVLA